MISKTLGFLFESLSIRDLKVYSSARGGVVSYYHDRLNLEADAVLHLEDGRYSFGKNDNAMLILPKGVFYWCVVKKIQLCLIFLSELCILKKNDMESDCHAKEI